MRRVTSLGGIFFKCEDPKAQREWYAKHLGLRNDEYGTTFEWRKSMKPDEKGFTLLNTFKKDTDYFEPSQKDFMMNFRVENLEALVDTLRKEGVQVIGKIQVYDYGKFAHIMDPEGNKVELWEADDHEYAKMVGEKVMR